MTIEQIMQRKRAWAKSLSDKDQSKAWLDFYEKFWGTEEGRDFLEKIASGELTPLQ